MIVNGWFTWAERVPGHPKKVNGGTNPAIGFIGHSAEGGENYLRDNPSQAPEVGGRKSWHLSNLTDGGFLQHYPITARCWASGSPYPNDNFVAMESEGMAGTPLNEAQIANASRALKELSELQGWTPQRLVTVWEHREATRWGSLATACPSNRYPWDEILERVNGGDELSQAEQEELGDRRALAFVLRELTWPSPGQVGEGIYRPVSVDDNGTHLLIELRNPDRTPLAEPVRFWVRK